MLGLLDPKKIGGAVLGEMKLPEKAPEEADFKGALEQIAAEIIGALDAKDPGALAKSLSNFLVMCEKDEEYSEEG